MNGQFIEGDYLSNDFSRRLRIRVQPETLTLVLDGQANSFAGGSYIDLPRIKVGGSRRGYGNYARRVWFRFAGLPPSGYAVGSELSLPWLRPERFSALSSTSVGTYQGFAIEYVKRQDERLDRG